MAIFGKNSVFRKLKRDESGTMALTWAVSLAAMLGAMGAAVDYAMLSAADARSQTIADTTALAAAIYVKNHEVVPTDRNKGLVGSYTAKELGYDYRNWVKNGPDGVTISVTYDDINRQATTTVSGYTTPTLMQIFGFEQLAFKARTVVNYFDQDLLDPASIVMVLDNSGSMDFDDMPLDSDGNRPAAAQPRIDGLEDGAKNLMTLLDNIVGSQDGSSEQPRVLRTGMMAFASDIIDSRTVNMKWGTLTDSSIDAMSPGGATNSAPPMTTAGNWLNVNEPPVHAAENPSKTPLKFIILMTDGKNTVGEEEWVARAGTQNWRAWLQVDTEIEEVESTENYEAEDFVDGENCEWDYRDDERRDVWWRGDLYENDPWYIMCDRVTTTTIETPIYDWVYVEQESMPLTTGDWEEGEFDIESNILTRAECDTLHASGVEIFSIAFALQTGDYRTNQWGINNGYSAGADYTRHTSDEDANKARAILQYCASEPSNFITADDSSALDAAFTRIGNDIVQEIIRISS